MRHHGKASKNEKGERRDNGKTLLGELEQKEDHQEALVGTDWVETGVVVRKRCLCLLLLKSDHHSHRQSVTAWWFS